MGPPYMLPFQCCSSLSFLVLVLFFLEPPPEVRPVKLCCTLDFLLWHTMQVYARGVYKYIHIYMPCVIHNTRTCRHGYSPYDMPPPLLYGLAYSLFFLAGWVW